MQVGYPEPENIVWQTREGVELSDFEKALSEALETVFDDGVHELDGIVDRLNAMGLRTHQGESWTAANFESEMKRLGR